MSTKERYGTIVWQALKSLTDESIIDYDVWASANAVGETAGVSAMTARKYLNEMVEMGVAERTRFGGISGYRTSRSGGHSEC